MISTRYHVLCVQERMRVQREDLELRVREVEKASSLLAEKEEELRVLQDSAARASAERAALEADVGRLKAALREAQGEVASLRKATKEAALTAQQLAEARTRSEDLEKDVARLKVSRIKNNLFPKQSNTQFIIACLKK
jgi:chromosome segregation ATPase